MAKYYPGKDLDDFLQHLDLYPFTQHLLELGHAWVHEDDNELEFEDMDGKVYGCGIVGFNDAGTEEVLKINRQDLFELSGIVL